MCRVVSLALTFARFVEVGLVGCARVLLKASQILWHFLTRTEPFTAVYRCSVLLLG